MPFSKESEGKILINYEEIVNEITIDQIVDKLISKRILTLDNLERINSKATNRDKNAEFVRILLAGPPKGFELFIETLKKDGCYTELAEKIENTEVAEDTPSTVESWIGEELLTTEKGEEYLKEKDILEFSRAINPNCLGSIATCLNIRPQEVECIKYNKHHSSEMCCELIRKWRDRTGPAANVRSLLEKLHEASQINVESVYVEEIQKKLRKTKC